MCVRALSPVRLFVTPRTTTLQAPLSRGFSRQEYWSGLPSPLPGELPDPGLEPTSPGPPALAGRFFTTEPPGKPRQQGAWGCTCQVSFKVQGKKEVVHSTGTPSGRMGGMCLLWKGDAGIQDRVSETGHVSVKHWPSFPRWLSCGRFPGPGEGPPFLFRADSSSTRLSALSNQEHSGHLLSCAGMHTGHRGHRDGLDYRPSRGAHSLVGKLPWKPRFNRVPSKQQMAQMVKNLPAVHETGVRYLGQEDPLEKETATHSSILAWRIPMDRGAWQATVHGVTELDPTEQLTHTCWGVPHTPVGKMPWKPRYNMVPCRQQHCSAVLPQGSCHDPPLGSLPATPSHISMLHSQVTYSFKCPRSTSWPSLIQCKVKSRSRCQ